VRACDHTDKMLLWWRGVGVDHIDIAVRCARPSEDDGRSTWLWHRAVPLADLSSLLPWTRALNACGSDVYACPARGSNWPGVFLDDLPKANALHLTTRYQALCVHTSPAGGCQLWLRCQQSLDEKARYHLQKHLASLLDADPGSVSGEHLGRLAGYRNWKRCGPWVNVLAATQCGPLITHAHEPDPPSLPLTPTRSRGQQQPGPDISESGRD